MALKEARVNGELAKSSKTIAEATMKDSSAMKSIAVLTMVFLPATAVAVSPSFLHTDRFATQALPTNVSLGYL